MPIDDRTANRNYKLPNAGNFLADDVARLRDALNAIDADVYARYTKTEVDQLIANLVSGAPGALDTLNELAAALGNDANFASTVTTALANRYTKAESDARYVQGVTQTENIFTGNGSQTAFTLTQTPPTRESLLVTVDGVVQPTSEYALSGATLTLSEAPASGAKIRVLMLGVAGPVQSASTLSFTQAGAGAVTRTVDSKLKDIVDRDDFSNDTDFNNASVSKVAINGSNTVLAPRFEGNTTTDAGTPDAVFRVNRTHTGSTSPHSFRDQTVFNPSSAGVAACSYDAALTSSGSQNQDHTIGFQARNAHGGSGTLSYLQGFGSYLIADGPVTNSHGLEINSVTGAGTVANEYGIYIKNLTKGTNKYPIFIANNLGTNSIGANTNFNSAGQVSVGGLVKIFMGDGGNGYKSIAYNHNINANTYDYGDYIQSIYFGPQDITFRCAPAGTAGATPSFTNILNIRTDTTNPSYRAVFPATDNVSNLGVGGLRWKEIFCANGTINTSDARVKTEVRQLNESEIASAKVLAKEIGAYKFLDSVAEKGDSARTHIGMTVQRAIEIMEQHGLDPLAYGFICHDQWEDEYEDVPAVPSWVEDPETGDLIQGPDKEPAQRKRVKEAGDMYSFRTEQLLLFIARGFEARLSALEAA